MTFTFNATNDAKISSFETPKKTYQYQVCFKLLIGYLATRLGVPAALVQAPEGLPAQHVASTATGEVDQFEFAIILLFNLNIKSLTPSRVFCCRRTAT